MKNYINEKWPTGNSNPGVYYRLNWQDSRSSSSQHFYTVDDLETGVQQLKRHGKEITKAMRVEIVNGKTTETPFIPETRQEKTDRENRTHCRHIAENLEAYVDGQVYRCPECGEEIRLPENVGDRYRCPECGTVSDVDDLEQLSIYDYLEDVLDIEYRIESDRKTLRSVRFMVACGGPNIYIDTATRAVALYWWTDHASYPISSDAADALDEYAQECWNC